MILFKTLLSVIMYHISSTHGSVLSHASPFVAQNLTPPTQYVVSFTGSLSEDKNVTPLPEYMLSLNDR